MKEMSMIHNVSAHDVRSFARDAADACVFVQHLPNGVTLASKAWGDTTSVQWNFGGDFAIQGQVPHDEASIYEAVVDILQPIVRN